VLIPKSYLRLLVICKEWQHEDVVATRCFSRCFFYHSPAICDSNVMVVRRHWSEFHFRACNDVDFQRPASTQALGGGWCGLLQVCGSIEWIDSYNRRYIAFIPEEIATVAVFGLSTHSLTLALTNGNQGSPKKKHRTDLLYLGRPHCYFSNGSLVGEVLRDSNRRQRYDFFLQNGFPEWSPSPKLRNYWHTGPAQTTSTPVSGLALVSL